MKQLRAGESVESVKEMAAPQRAKNVSVFSFSQLTLFSVFPQLTLPHVTTVFTACGRCTSQCPENAMKLVLWNEIVKTGKKGRPQPDAGNKDDKPAPARAAKDETAGDEANGGEEASEEEQPELDPPVDAEEAEDAVEQPAETQPEDPKDVS